jgi:DNA-binding beta-propeller fold protein YncE
MRPRLLLLALLLAGCSQREHANPLDPDNPHTGGGPAGFMAIAGDRRIDLRWVPIGGGKGVSGFHLYRQAGTDSAYHLVSGLLPSATSGYADVGALNGLTHRYRLYYVSEDGTDREPAATDVATPGAARGWVVDSGRHALYRITPDGRRVVSTYTGFDGPRSVGVDSVTGHVWVSDAFEGTVAIVDPATGVTIHIPGLGVPSSLAVDPLMRVAWICDELDGKLWSFDSSGQPSGNVIEPLQTPIGVAVDVFDRSVVICEYDGNRLRRHASDHSLLATLTLTRPTRVAIDSVTRRAWVTSFEGKTLSRVPPSFSTVEATIPGFQGPVGVAIDALRGRIWVADALAGQLVALDRSGTVQFKVSNLRSVRDVAVDPNTGEVWAVLPDQGELVHLSSGGAILSRLATFAQPLGVAVDPGR